MSRTLLSLAACLAATGMAAAMPHAALAAAADYRFELTSARPAAAGGTDVTVRLVHAADHRPIAGAIIFQPRAIMPGMENMPGAATVEPGPLPGTYLLHVATSMSGPWTLHFSAKVNGEAETLRAAVPFEASE